MAAGEAGADEGEAAEASGIGGDELGFAGTFYRDNGREHFHPAGDVAEGEEDSRVYAEGGGEAFPVEDGHGAGAGLGDARLDG